MGLSLKDLFDIIDRFGAKINYYWNAFHLVNIAIIGWLISVKKDLLKQQQTKLLIALGLVLYGIFTIAMVRSEYRAYRVLAGAIKEIGERANNPKEGIMSAEFRNILLEFPHENPKTAVASIIAVAFLMILIVVIFVIIINKGP